MTLKIGYARLSTDDQDLTAQRDALAALGVVVVTKLDRLARSLPDARDIVAELTGRGRAEPGWFGARPDRPGEAAAVQRANFNEKRSTPLRTDTARRRHQPEGSDGHVT